MAFGPLEPLVCNRVNLSRSVGMLVVETLARLGVWDHRAPSAIA